MFNSKIFLTFPNIVEMCLWLRFVCLYDVCPCSNINNYIRTDMWFLYAIQDCHDMFDIEKKLQHSWLIYKGTQKHSVTYGENYLRFMLIVLHNFKHVWNLYTLLMCTRRWLLSNVQCLTFTVLVQRNSKVFLMLWYILKIVCGILYWYLLGYKYNEIQMSLSFYCTFLKFI